MPLGAYKEPEALVMVLPPELTILLYSQRISWNVKLNQAVLKPWECKILFLTMLTSSYREVDL